MFRLRKRVKETVERTASTLKNYGLSGSFRTIIEYHVLRRTRYPIFIAPDGSKFILVREFEEAIESTIDEVFIMREYSLVEDYEPSRNDTVVDAGAFIGAYTIYAARRSSRVIALEPSPFRILLYYNTVINNLHNVEIMPHALADYNGLGKFFFNITGPTGSSLYEINGHVKILKVPVTTLDNLINHMRLKSINILKMDIEGAECSALRGAKDSLEKGLIEKIVLELHPWLCPKEEVLEYMKALDYRLDHGVKLGFTLNKTFILYFRSRL